MESTLILVLYLPGITAVSFVQHVPNTVRYSEEFVPFYLDCVRKCTRSENCVASHIDGDKCQNVDWNQYTQFIKSVSSGVLYRKNYPACQNGGHYSKKKKNRCKCERSYSGKYCERHIEDCSEGYRRGSRGNGVYTIQPKLSSSPFKVFCDMHFGQGRTYIQKQEQGINFKKNWQKYKTGFGKVQKDHWLGLQKIKEIVSSSRFRLLIECKQGRNFKQSYFLDFKITDESDGYRMSYSSHAPSGSLQYCLKDLNGSRFSTWDQDNDRWDGGHCADVHESGWWFSNCTRCNLNGILKPGPGIPRSKTAYLSDIRPKIIFLALEQMTK